MIIGARLVFNTSAPQPSQDRPGKNVSIMMALSKRCMAGSREDPLACWPYVLGAHAPVAANGRPNKKGRHEVKSQQDAIHPARVAREVDPTMSELAQGATSKKKRGPNCRDIGGAKFP